MLNMKAEFVIYAVIRRDDRLEFAGRCTGCAISVGDEFTWAYSYRQPGKTKSRRHKEIEIRVAVEAILFSEWKEEEVTWHHKQMVLPEQAARLILVGETPDLLSLLGERSILGIATA